MAQKRPVANRNLFRIFDANFNRSKEALRVTEDLARFVFKDKQLAAAFKKSRHELTRVLLDFPVPYRRLLEARDSKNDVGKKSIISDRKGKPGCQDLFTANMKRAQESFRVLEEFSKMVDPKASSKFQRLRFESYELERRSLRKF